MDKFKTKLIGQENIEELFNRIIDDNDIPHIFLTGMYGTGKTTICNEFINYYYKKKNIKDKSRWIMNLSSEKDRGIHCVRQNVAEFVHHSSAKEGIYRWIIIDDVDTFPQISQQALRRPMESYSHIARFLFIGTSEEDLIPALRSRCIHISMNKIEPILYKNEFLK